MVVHACVARLAVASGDVATHNRVFPVAVDRVRRQVAIVHRAEILSLGGVDLSFDVNVCKLWDIQMS